MAETNDCSKGYGKTHNNCHGILSKRKPIAFKNKKASYDYFKNLWTISPHYQRFPTMKEAKKYTGNDSAKTWLIAVEQYYK
jgi:hypothetical protein